MTKIQRRALAVAAAVSMLGGSIGEAQVEVTCHGGFLESGIHANLRPLEHDLNDFAATMLTEPVMGSSPLFYRSSIWADWRSFNLSPVFDPETCVRSVEVFSGTEHVGGIYGTVDLYQLQVILRLESDTTESWWRLWFDDDPAMEIADITNMSRGPRLKSVGPAGPDLETGIVRLLFESEQGGRRNGAWANWSTDRTVLVDLRGERPRVIASASCTGFNDVEAESRCAQEPSTDRFSCVDEAYFEIPWDGRRTVVGRYDLASLETKTLEISDLNGLTRRLFAVAESLANAPQVIPPSIRGAGKVRHLAVIRGSPSSGRGHLLAISRAHGNFGSLFVIVWKDIDGTINLHSLKPLGAPPDGYLASSEDLRIVWKNRVPRPWMSPLTTSKLSIENEECLSLPGVDTYRVAESEGDGSASYIIAVNQNGDGVIFVLSASFRAYGWDWWQTDSVTYARCLGGSTLELEVEPKNMRWMTGRDFRTDPECPFTLELAASRNAVMRIVEKPHVDGCKPRSPVVVITEPGRGIAIKPWQEFLDSMSAEQDKVDPGLIHRR